MKGWGLTAISLNSQGGGEESCSAPTQRDQLRLTALPGNPPQKGDLCRRVAFALTRFIQEPKQQLFGEVC